MTSDLAEFLLARIAEDEAVAYGGAPSPWREGEWDGEVSGPRQVLDRYGDVTAECYYGGTYGHVLRFDPTRILIDCSVRRELVTLGKYWMNGIDFDGEEILLRLALPYHDHPDFREEWRP